MASNTISIALTLLKRVKQSIWFRQALFKRKTSTRKKSQVWGDSVLFT